VDNDVDYYSKNDYISHSLLTQMHNHPEWMEYVELMKGRSEPYLEKGKLIHTFLLEKEKFNKTYKVTDAVQPKSAQQNTFCELMATTDYSKEQAYNASYVANKKTKEEADKLYMQYKPYIDDLKKYGKENLIQEREHKKLLEINDALEKNKWAYKLIHAEDKFVEYNFFGEVTMDYANLKISEPIKAKLDLVSIDHKEKRIYVADLKTISYKSPKENVTEEIKRRMEDYNYIRQLAFYSLIASDYWKHLVTKGYEIVPIIIFVAVAIPYSVRVYRLSNNAIMEKVHMEIEPMIKEYITYKKEGVRNGIDYIKNKDIPILL